MKNINITVVYLTKKGFEVRSETFEAKEGKLTYQYNNGYGDFRLPKENIDKIELVKNFQGDYSCRFFCHPDNVDDMVEKSKEKIKLAIENEIHNLNILYQYFDE